MRFSFFALLILLCFIIFNQANAQGCVTEPHNRGVVNIIEETQEQDLWTTEAAQNLTYCISPFLKKYREKVLSALFFAADEWAKYGNVKFEYIENENCKKGGDQLFIVRWAPRQASFAARAFFPSSPKEKRELLINRRVANASQAEFDRLMLHEMGHVLGLRHEHIHPGANGVCDEDPLFEVVADYDPESVMHYPKCGKKNTKNFVLSEGDKATIAILYPY